MLCALRLCLRVLTDYRLTGNATFSAAAIDATVQIYLTCLLKLIDEHNFDIYIHPVRTRGPPPVMKSSWARRSKALSVSDKGERVSSQQRRPRRSRHRRSRRCWT